MARIASRRTDRGEASNVFDNGSIAVPQALTAAVSHPVTSAAATGGVSTSRGQGAEWKQQAWTFFDNVGELRYVVNWLSNALSRCTIIASDIDPDTGQPTGSSDDVLANETVRDIAGGPAGQAELFGKMATYFTVPGEMYLAILIRPDKSGVEREEWHILSTEEVKRSSGKVEISLPDGKTHELNDDTDTLSLVHRPHPRKAAESDSPVRAAIPILREIVRLGQHIEATAKSRLAGNGLMVLPQELSMPVSNAPTGQRAPDPDAPGLPAVGAGLPDPAAGTGATLPAGFSTRSVNANDVMQALVQAASAAIDDPAAASALLPLLLQAPGEFLDKIKHITLGTDFTEVVMKLRDAAIRRLALSLDVPAEILLGTGDMNHWSAWQVEESAIKLHIEPLMVLICDALTVDVLRPMLVKNQHPDPDSVTIWYDTTGLAMRPNRSQDAKDAHDRGVLSNVALLANLGFDTDDALDLTDEDHMRAFITSLVLKNPALLADATVAGILGLPAIAGLAPAAPQGGEPADTQTGPQPVPDEPEEIAAAASARALALACIQRALALAGNRLRTRGNLARVNGTPRHDTHVVLGSAITDHDRVDRLINGWEDVMTPVQLDTARADATRLAALVDGKVRAALANRTPLARVKVSTDEARSVLR